MFKLCDRALLCVSMCMSFSLCMSLYRRFNGRLSSWTWVIRHRNVSILDFIAAKVDGGDMCMTGAMRSAKPQSNCHHQQTNTQLFTGRLPPNQQCQSTEGKPLCLSL